MEQLKKLEQSTDNADSIIAIKETFRTIQQILELMFEWLQNIEEVISKEN